MLNFLILWKSSFKNNKDVKLPCEALKWELVLPLYISIIKYSMYYITLMLLEKYFKDLQILIRLLAFIPIVIVIRRIIRREKLFYPSAVEEFLEEIIRRYCITPKGNALNRKDFKTIKKQNKSLYYKITSDYCKGACYLYAREIALLFKDSKLIYCAATNPTDQDEIFAHAILERNGEIYDTNRRMSYKVDDYIRIFNIDIFKKWTYEEFSKDNFREQVRSEFGRWCEERNVICYDFF